MRLSQDTARPTTAETVAALRCLRDALGQDDCYWSEGRFYFPLASDVALALSPDDAGRFRVEACLGMAPLATMWVLARDLDRLGSVAAALEIEAVALD